jgi:hypothetical protein
MIVFIGVIDEKVEMEDEVLRKIWEEVMPKIDPNIKGKVVIPNVPKGDREQMDII